MIEAECPKHKILYVDIVIDSKTVEVCPKCEWEREQRIREAFKLKSESFEEFAEWYIGREAKMIRKEQDEKEFEKIFEENRGY